MFRRFLVKMQVSIQIRMLHKQIQRNIQNIDFYADFFIQLIISNLIILFQSARNEESLSTELQSLKDQVNLKRSSMNEHVSHLESLREEVGLPLLASFTRNFIKMIWVMT